MHRAVVVSSSAALLFCRDKTNHSLSLCRAERWDYDTNNGTDRGQTAISKNTNPSLSGDTGSVAKVDNRVEITKETPQSFVFTLEKQALQNLWKRNNKVN